MKNYWKYFCYLIITLQIILGCLHFFKNDIYYDTDIARDFLLLDDMYTNQKPSLIGGRSSIAGVFHGPLYYWLVLPLFMISGGNPVVVAIFWLIAYWLFLASFYLIGKKTFGTNFALLSTTLISSLTTFLPQGYTHTVLANFLIIPIIYFAYLYLIEKKPWQLLTTIFMVGLLIQFQMAFGVPVLIILGTYLFYQIVRHHNFKHLLSIFIILLPLSTFLVFDLRHDFIQVRSAINGFIEKKETIDQKNYLSSRLIAFRDSFSLIKYPAKNIQTIFNFIGIICIFLLLYHLISYKNSSIKHRSFIFLLLLIFIGFWLITLPYKDNIWPHYYRVLLPIIIFITTYVFTKILPSQISFIFFTLLIGCNFFANLNEGLFYWQSQPTDDEIHWKFYRQLTNDVFQDSHDQNFGYFVHSPDLYGYQAKYALKYFSQKNQIPSLQHQKKPLTYLVIATYAGIDGDEYHSDLIDYWQINQVRINQPPSTTWIYPVGYVIRRFDLDDAEATVSADPTLLDGIHFR